MEPRTSVNTKVMTTMLGVAIDPLKPATMILNMSDAAMALAQQARYAGHAYFRFSVAQHSVLAARICEKLYGQYGAFATFMHDVQEAVLMDVPRPVKQVMREYKKFELRWEELVWNDLGCRDHYGFEFESEEYVELKRTVIKPCDRLALILEMAYLKHPDCQCADYLDSHTFEDVKEFAPLVREELSGQCYREFLAQYYKYKNGETT